MLERGLGNRDGAAAVGAVGVPVNAGEVWRTGLPVPVGVELATVVPSVEFQTTGAPFVVVPGPVMPPPPPASQPAAILPLAPACGTDHEVGTVVARG